MARAASYHGRLEGMPPHEAAQQISELLAYFGFDRDGDLRAPPTGMPGDTLTAVDTRILAAMRLGVRYLHALASRRPRGQLQACAEAEQTIGPMAELLFEQRKTVIVDLCTERTEQDTLAKRELSRVARRASGQRVYFIAADDGPIKIGIAADPAKRLADLQTSHHAPLRILATTDGGLYQERRHHSRFEKHRRKGEWFARCRPILAKISRLNRATGSVAA